MNTVRTFERKEADIAFQLGYDVNITINGKKEAYSRCYTWDERLLHAKRKGLMVFWEIDYAKNICFSCRHWHGLHHTETGRFQWLGGCAKDKSIRITSPNSTCEQFTRNGDSAIEAASANAVLFQPQKRK